MATKEIDLRKEEKGLKEGIEDVASPEGSPLYSK
jgi:hypothetical protein